MRMLMMPRLDSLISLFVSLFLLSTCWTQSCGQQLPKKGQGVISSVPKPNKMADSPVREEKKARNVVTVEGISPSQRLIHDEPERVAARVLVAPERRRIDRFRARLDLGLTVGEASPFQGVVVEEIGEGGVAAKVGLRRGDRIVALEQRLLTGTSSFEREIRNFQEAEGIELLYVRQEKLHRVRVMPHKSDRISTDGESRPVATGNFSGDLRNSQDLGLQAAETASAVGQAVLGGLGAAWEGWLQQGASQPKSTESNP